MSDLDYLPYIKTERFDVFHAHVTRNPQIGAGRDVFMAWFRSDDVPRSVCEVTLFGNYVEWVHVCEHYRRQGIATEVLTAMERELGELDMEGVTESGVAFCESFCKESEATK